jgi:putative MFS transporter
VGSLAGFFSFGFVFAALLGYFVVPAHSEGWRFAQIITFLPIVMLLWWRRSLPESPRFLMQRGRSAEAQEVVENMEATFTTRGVDLQPYENVQIPALGARKAGSILQNLAGVSETMGESMS